MRIYCFYYIHLDCELCNSREKVTKFASHEYFFHKCIRHITHVSTIFQSFIAFGIMAYE